MAGNGCKLTGDWDKLQFTLGSEGQARVVKKVRQATKENALVLVKEMRERINNRRYRANAPLTLAIKPSDLPLVDHGTSLFQAITWAMINPDTALAGVLKTAPAKDAGMPPYELGIRLHEGAVIPVTRRMHELFNYLAAYTHGEIPKEKLTGKAAEIAERLKPGQLVHPLKRTTRAIIIPARPFLRDPATDTQIVNACLRRWREAYQAGLRRPS